MAKDLEKKEEVTPRELLIRIFGTYQSTKGFVDNFIEKEDYSQRAQPLLQHYELFRTALDQIKKIGAESGAQLENTHKRKGPR